MTVLERRNDRDQLAIGAALASTVSTCILSAPNTGRHPDEVGEYARQMTTIGKATASSTFRITWKNKKSKGRRDKRNIPPSDFEFGKSPPYRIQVGKGAHCEPSSPLRLLTKARRETRLPEQGRRCGQNQACRGASWRQRDRISKGGVSPESDRRRRDEISIARDRYFLSTNADFVSSQTNPAWRLSSRSNVLINFTIRLLIDLRLHDWNVAW